MKRQTANERKEIQTTQRRETKTERSVTQETKTTPEQERETNKSDTRTRDKDRRPKKRHKDTQQTTMDIFIGKHRKAINSARIDALDGVALTE